MPIPITSLPNTIPNTSLADTAPVPVLSGKAGEIIDTKLHGKYYVSSYRKQNMLSAGAAVGTIIAVSSATKPNFVLYNPIGSGVVAEIEHVNVSWTVVTSVVSGISLGMITQLIVAPTSLTAIPIMSSYGGVVTNPSCQLFSRAKLAAAATRFFTLFSVSAVQSVALPNFMYQFDGTLALQPGSLVFLCGTVAQKNATLNSISWNEFPA